MENTIEINAIKSAISKAGFSWEPSANHLTTMSDDDRKVMLGYEPGPGEVSLEEQERICSSNLNQYLSSSKAAGFASFGIPASIDWRNKGGQNYVTPVKNQGNCGSCVSFGTIASVESRVKIERGSSFQIDLSEAHLFYCIARAENRNCGNGWWPERAMIGFRDIGVTDESCYPYTAGDQNCTGRSANWASYLTKITGYTRVSTIATIKEWIANNGPAEACFTVYNDFFSYSSGVYRKTSNVVAGGHCVCIVGYDDTEGCWICKNSWGAGFGMGGFFKIAYGECGIEGQVFGVNSTDGNYTLNGVKVQGFWVNNEVRNAWAYITNYGWRKISNNNDNGFRNTLTQLAAAKAINANVSITLTQNQITTLYVS